MKKGHYARVCRSRNTETPKQKQQVKVVDEQKDIEYVELNHITAATQNKAFATFKVLDTKEEIQFQLDTGASCNVLSFQDYVRATGDLHEEELSETRTVLVMHNKIRVKLK